MSARSIRRRRHGAPIMLALVLAAALVPVAASPALALTLRDMLGREVTMPSPPRRIVSLVPSVTEIVFSLGAQDRLEIGRAHV